MTNSGLLYLCQVAEDFKDGPDTKPLQDVSARLAKHSAINFEEKSLKGLKFITEYKESSAIDKLTIKTSEDADIDGLNNFPGVKVPVMKTRIHRSYLVEISLTRDILGSDL